MLLPEQYTAPSSELPKPTEYKPPQSDPFGISLIVYGIQLFTKIFLQSTVLLWAVLMSLGVPQPIALAINSIVMFVYVVGIIQIYTGRSVEGE